MVGRILTLVAFFIIAVGAEAAPPPAPTRLAPVDEAGNDPSFVQFRNELKAIIARKDAAKLFHYLASDVRVSFGGGSGDYGGPEFHKMWKPFDKDTKVWKALSLVIDNGGKSPAPGAFVAPWVYATFSEDLDAFTHVVVTNPQAVLRAHPNANAPVIRKLDYDVLTVVGTAQDDLVLGGKLPPPQHECHSRMWILVKDAKGVGGCVPACDVRSPVDYRAIFEKRKGKWVIQTFLAGD